MTVSRFLPLSLALTLLLPAVAADPSLVDLVMPNAKSVAGIAVEQARSSPFGQFMLSRMQAENANFQKFVTETGFDPRTDLTEIVVASENTVASHDHGLVVARGRFDVSRILSAAGQSGASTATYRGVQMLVHKDTSTGKQGAVAFPDSTLAIAGDVAAVDAAIDRRQSGSKLGGSLAAKVAQVSSQNQMWFVTDAPSARFAGQGLTNRPNASRGQMTIDGSALKTVEQLSGGLNFGQTVLISAEAITQSDKDAAALADVVRFLAGLIQTNSGSPQGQQVATLLQTMQLTTTKNVLKLTLSLSEEQLETMVRQRPHHAPAGRRHRPETQLD